MSANPQDFGDSFGNLGNATDFGNTNALGASASNTATNPLGPIESFSGGSVAPTSNTGVAAPAATPQTVGIGGSGVGGAPTGAGASAGFDWGQLFGDIGTGVSDFLNSPLGSLAEFTALYKVISNQAADTQKQNNDLAGQISAIGQPDVAAGKSMLDAYTHGNLTAPFKAQADAAKYQDQQTATSQTQQVASALANAGGQNMQSAQISQSGQINAQRDQADRLAVSNAFLAELSASLNLTQTGGAFVQAGIMQEIQSNTQLQAQLADLMGSLAKAYAQQTAQSGKGGSGGGGGNVLGDVANIWNDVKGLFGKGAPAAGPTLASDAAALTPVAAPDLSAAASAPAFPSSTFAAADAPAAAAPAAAAPAAASAAPAAAAAAAAPALATDAAALSSVAAPDLAAAASAPAFPASTFAAADAAPASGSGAGAGAVVGAAAAVVAEAYMVYKDWESNNGGLGRSGQVITLSNADGTGPGNIPIHPWDYKSKDPAVLKRYTNMAKIIKQQKDMNANAAKRGPNAAQTV